MSIEVRAAVTVYQDDDSEWGQSTEEVKVESHWNDESFVVVEMVGHRYTVKASDLMQAIRAASRV